MTDFFHISEPKSNIVETTSSNAIDLCSFSSDYISGPEPNVKIVLSEPNLHTKSSNVAEDEGHRLCPMHTLCLRVKETIQHDMDVGCRGVISDHLRDYCCQVEVYSFNILIQIFLLQRYVLLAINSNDVVLNRYFGENN